MQDGKRGKVVVVSGPSGAGKGTVVRQFLKCPPVPFVESVSATTRAPRPGEVDGVDYRFLSEEEFLRRQKNGEFLECFQVFRRGYWYGTLIQDVEPNLAAGKWVLLEIDVNGARMVLEHYPDALTIFIDAGSMEELERRLRGRQTENEETIQARLAEAATELLAAKDYQYRVVNDSIERAAAEMYEIIEMNR